LVVLGRKFEILVENLRFWSKFWDFGRNFEILVENLRFWSKIWDSGQKFEILVEIMHNYEIFVENLRFWSKILVFDRHLIENSRFWSVFDKKINFWSNFFVSVRSFYFQFNIYNRMWIFDQNINWKFFF